MTGRLSDEQAGRGLYEIACIRDRLGRERGPVVDDDEAPAPSEEEAGG